MDIDSSPGSLGQILVCIDALSSNTTHRRPFIITPRCDLDFNVRLIAIGRFDHRIRATVHRYGRDFDLLRVFEPPTHIVSICLHYLSSLMFRA